MADLKEQIDVTNGTCTIDECERAVYGHGLCNAHWQKQREGAETRTCTIEGCDRKLRARSWCTMHYTRWRETGDPGPAAPRPRVNSETCRVDGCNRKYYGRGYCHLHWNRIRRTGNVGTAEALIQQRRPCSFGGCEQLQRGNGLCGGHYQQQRLGKALVPLRPRWKSTTRDEHGRKRCSGCTAWLDVAAFYPSPKNTDGLTTYCKRCDRNARLLRNYGITLAQYEAMLEAQGGTCAICGGAPKDGPSLHVDHDHACCPARKKSCGQCLRGLLCEDCNRVLGMFRDEPARFQSAINYLSRARP